jgi:hypothetical protein
MVTNLKEYKQDLSKALVHIFDPLNIEEDIKIGL